MQASSGGSWNCLRGVRRGYRRARAGGLAGQIAGPVLSASGEMVGLRRQPEPSQELGHSWHGKQHRTVQHCVPRCPVDLLVVSGGSSVQAIRQRGWLLACWAGALLCGLAGIQWVYWYNGASLGLRAGCGSGSR